MIATVTLNPSLDEWMHLPVLRVGALNRASGFARYPGGKGINVSRVVRELGGKTVAFAFAGGEDGLILRQLMNRLSIPHEFVEVHGTTRNNYKIRTERPRALTEINAEGPRVSRAVLPELERRLLRQRPAPRVVVLSGSLPPGVTPSTYPRWIRLLRRRRIPTALDTSGAALTTGLAARPWLIKPNRQEAEEILRTRLTRMRQVVAAAQQLLRQGPEIVMLSLGREGALIACGDLPAPARFASQSEAAGAQAGPRGVWLAHPPPVTVDSAVGAGDSLVGGFLVGWMKGVSLLEAFRLGVACGTATAITPGTELCHRADVRRILRRVRIRRLA